MVSHTTDDDRRTSEQSQVAWAGAGNVVSPAEPTDDGHAYTLTGVDAQ